MHELSIARNIVRVVSEHLERYPGGRVLSISLQVGVYSGVNPAYLRSAFPVTVEGTPLQDAELLIETVHASFRCRDCGESGITPGVTSCPCCRSANLEMATGTELEISSIELDIPG